MPWPLESADCITLSTTSRSEAQSPSLAFPSPVPAFALLGGALGLCTTPWRSLEEGSGQRSQTGLSPVHCCKESPVLRTGSSLDMKPRRGGFGLRQEHFASVVLNRVSYGNGASSRRAPTLRFKTTNLK